MNISPETMLVWGIRASSFNFNGAQTPTPFYCPDVFRTVQATSAGETAIWAPAANYVFNLMGVTISVCGTQASAGEMVIQLEDGTGGIIFANFNAFVGTSENGDSHMGADFGNGYLSIALTNSLFVILGAAMATGHVMVNAWGTEVF